MSHSIHRVRDPLGPKRAEGELQATEGVREVRVNPRAGSITVHFEPEHLTQARILERLEQVGCPGASIRTDQGATRVNEVFGKTLVGAVMQKAVERSALRLVSVLL